MGVPVCPASCLLPRARRASEGWQGPVGCWGVWAVTVSDRWGSASVAEALGQVTWSPSPSLYPLRSWRPGVGGARQPQHHLRARLQGKHHSSQASRWPNLQSLWISERGHCRWGLPAILQGARSYPDWRENNFTFEACLRNRMVSALILKNGSVSPTSGILK